jgi:hypothetical protein
MKILFINSSYNGKKGYTQVVLDWIKQEFSDHEINCRYTKDDRIGRCRGCRNCTVQARGKCHITDSMQIYMRYMQNSDLIVLGAPIYANLFSSKLKSFFERLRPLTSGKYDINEHGNFYPLPISQHKYNFLIVSICDFPGVNNFEPSRMFFEYTFNNSDHYVDMGGIYIPAFPYINENKQEIIPDIKNEISAQIIRVKNNQKAFLYKEWVEKKEFKEYLKGKKAFQV